MIYKIKRPRKTYGGVTIIKDRHRKVVEEYFHKFTDMDNGFTMIFPCTKEGKLLVKSDESDYNYAKAHPEIYSDDGIKEKRLYFIIPAKGRCVCGNVFSMAEEPNGLCKCRACNSWFDLSGRRIYDLERAS